MSLRITGLSSVATRHILAEMTQAWRREHQCEAAFESVGGVDAMRRVLDGEAFDVVVLAADAIDKLTTAGRLLAGSRIDLARSGVAVAVRHGAPRPAIGSASDVREAVLAARGVGYSTGPSGTALLERFQEWGIAERLRDRLVQAPPGVPVGSLVARGEVDLGFQQLSELMHVAGIDVIGPLPPDLQVVTTFSGGIGAASTNAQAALALLKFIASPAGDQAIRRNGMEPARTASEAHRQEPS